MTSIVKKRKPGCPGSQATRSPNGTQVLRSGSGKKHGSKKDQLSPIGTAKPLSPPSPDLSGLTHDEVTILRDVLKRQEEFENEEINRKEKLREDLISYEEAVKRQASQKSKLKHVDLRLCRLCYKTKFADGIGKACYDCHKRVCNRCGAFSRPKWNPKKNKSVKGKWRCDMCQMKRDVLAKTGIWYHGSQEGQPAFPPKFLQKKLSVSEMDSSENDGSFGTGTTNPELTCYEAESYEREQESDIFTESQTPKSGRATFRRSRRRSSQSEKDTEDPEDDEMYIDDEQFQKERQLCRKQRHNRKCRRRERSHNNSVSSEKEVDWLIDRGTDSDHINDVSDCILYGDSNEFESSTDNILSSDFDTKSYNQKCTDRRNAYKERKSKDKRSREKEQRRESLKGRRTDVPLYDESSLRHKHKNEPTRRVFVPARGVLDVGQYEGHMTRTQSDPRLRDLRREDYHKRSNSDKLRSFSRVDDEPAYYSSSSSVVSDVRSQELRDYSNNHSSSSHRHIVSPSTLTPYQGSEEKESTAQHPKPLNSRREVIIQNSPVSTNSLSPDMALIRHSGRRKRRIAHGRDGSISPSRQRPLSVSPSHSGVVVGHHDTSPMTNEPSYQDTLVDSHGRRMTLSHCENIFLSEDTSFRHRNSLKSTKPHDILLHRDKSDLSQRTLGFGMRVVGGKKDSKGTLGAYVTMVTAEGSASTQGIKIGDHITEWNGRSLVNVTFEEAQDIMRQSGDIVQVTVIHRNTQNEESQALKHKRPIIVRADTLQETEIHPPENLILGRPKRRMLPKTPIEIKRNVKTISGSIWMQLDYDVKCQCILVVLIRGEKIMSLDGENRRGPNPVAMLHLLPNRAHHIPKETEIKFNTFDPDWNETFVFPNICEEELAYLSMEITVWNYKEVEDEFLGEVLLDLSEAKIDNTPTCYHLEDHDENSSPLPYRKKSFSLSEGSAISPVTSLEASSLIHSLNPSPRSSVSTKATGSQRTLPITPAHDKMRELIGQGKRSPGLFLQLPGPVIHSSDRLHACATAPVLSSERIYPGYSRERHDLSSSAHSSPVHSPHSEDGLARRNSFTSIMRKKMHALTRLSSSLILGTKKEHISDSSFNRSQSVDDVREPKFLETPSPAGPRRSFEGPPKRYDLLAPPHPLSRSNSSKDFFLEGDRDDDPLKSPNPDRVPPEGDDITSLLGPGQVPPKPALETNVLGDIKMGFMVSKGQLEIDIIVVKGLTKSGLVQPPDTYVKTYLVEGAKTVQKKKTHTVKMTFDPIFRKKIKYSACNIHGRCIKVNVWEKQKTFDKKNCLGEMVVKLDSLDLCQHTMAWYKLFPSGAMDYGSNESLSFW